mmetsp:Transcript_28222/g.71960  ORF Transcript_28222/g.71960 Transcript_28222/m.71960 type:complete len:205 (-) Transcript_28222:759-1373(-)
MLGAAVARPVGVVRGASGSRMGDAPVFRPGSDATRAGASPNSSHEGNRGEGPRCRCPPCACAGTAHRSAKSDVPDLGTMTSMALDLSPTRVSSWDQPTTAHTSPADSARTWSRAENSLTCFLSALSAPASSCTPTPPAASWRAVALNPNPSVLSAMPMNSRLLSVMATRPSNLGCSRSDQSLIWRPPRDSRRSRRYATTVHPHL